MRYRDGSVRPFNPSPVCSRGWIGKDVIENVVVDLTFRKQIQPFL
jgi:hypothetical protein